MGWIIFKRDTQSIGRVDISDLDADKVVTWQNQYYGWLPLLMSFIVPILVAGVGWDDWAGGFVYAGCLRVFIIQQNTYCINSLAHWLGDQPFQRTKSPRDNLLAAVLTLGEGYHNFHHEFPNDYRNGIRLFDFDPTKWFIILLARIRLAFDLKTFSENETRKGRFQEQFQSMVEESKTISWGLREDQLPEMSAEEMQTTCGKGRFLICIDGIIYDISTFKDEHPGGNVILQGVGKDASALFQGETHSHTNAARNLLSRFRAGRLEENMDCERLIS